MKKTVLITGATSGIGEACARRFAQGGYNLILTARRADRLDAVKTELEAQGAKVRILVFDVRDAEAAKAAVDSLEPEWQTIDVLINNAGLALGLEKEYEGDPDDWNTMIDTNIKGLLTMTRLIVPRMVERNEGHVINVTNLKPGLVETHFSNVRFHGDNQRAAQVYKGIQPLTGADIADVAFYAASAPKHVQIAEVLILATHQANGSVIHREAE